MTGAELPSSNIACSDPFSVPAFGYLLVKVAARCNIDCSYCYWFRDDSVLRKPKTMPPDVTAQLLRRVEEHVIHFQQPNFSLLLHGGEPLLWGKSNFRHFFAECNAISRRTGCDIRLSITTNGLLIDNEWAALFAEHRCSVTVSIDGPRDIHDARRRTFAGEGTHQDVLNAIECLRFHGIEPGILAVCDPTEPASKFVDFFCESLATYSFDILIPDNTWDDRPPRIARFYKELYDIWLTENRESKRLTVRTVENMLMGLIGGLSATESIGYGPIEFCTVLTDGSLEPLDMLRVAGNESTATSTNIFAHALEDVKKDPIWMQMREASLSLHSKCKSCRYQYACGGGHLPNRFSKAANFDNPSVYCDDLYDIFTHMQATLDREIAVAQSVTVGAQSE